MASEKRLIELLREGIRYDTEKKEAWIVGGKVGTNPNVFENMADYLIANDVDSVVRCKDCRWRREWLNCGAFYCCNPDYGMAGGVELKDDDFCSYGERKDNG